MMKKVLVALWLAVATVSSAFAAMGDEEFVDLCSKDKAAPQILAALAEGANPNARDGRRTALGQACFYAYRDGMKEVVTALLDKGADVNAVCDSEGETPLIRAAGDCGIEIVRRMVELGANVNARSESGLTPLAASETAEIAQFLLDKGAKVHNDAPFTTLMLACDSPDRPEVAELIIAHGGDVNARTDRGVSPILLAAANDCAGVVKVLAAHGANVNDRDRLGRTPLISAARAAGESTATLAALLDCGADIDAHYDDEHEYTALYEAVSSHIKADKALYLLDRGAKATDPKGYVYGYYDLLVRGKGKKYKMDEAERQKLIDRIHPVKK